MKLENRLDLLEIKVDKLLERIVVLEGKDKEVNAQCKHSLVFRDPGPPFCKLCGKEFIEDEVEYLRKKYL